MKNYIYEGGFVAVTKAAAMAVSTKAECSGFQEQPPYNQAHWENPPRTRCLQGDDDLRGEQFGRLTVVGQLPKKACKTKGFLWLVRCACGAYESRRTKAIKRADPNAKCQDCQYRDRVLNPAKQH